MISSDEDLLDIAHAGTTGERSMPPPPHNNNYPTAAAALSPHATGGGGAGLQSGGGAPARGNGGGSGHSAAEGGGGVGPEDIQGKSGVPAVSFFSLGITVACGPADPVTSVSTYL